ncbi:MAG: recombinase RecT [Myxococcaceae bacterium]|nr:recombinase RecT [Myxococcaceae bacterium]
MDQAIQKKLSPVDAMMAPVLHRVPSLKKLLPPHMSVDRFVMQVRMAFVRTPSLQQCEPASVLGAVLEAADLGLDPSGRLGSAYILPFKGKATLVPGYRGLIDLATRSGIVRSVQAFVVHARDTFEHQAGVMPHHVPYICKDPNAPEKEQDPGPWYAVWARVKLVGGGTDYVVMTRREVMAVKARSPGAKSAQSPWNGSIFDEEEMAKKTCIRRLMKVTALSPVPQAERLSRALEMGEGAIIEASPSSSDDSTSRAVTEVFDEAMELPAEAPTPATSTTEAAKAKL